MDLKEKHLKKYNEQRLAILRDLLSAYLGLDTVQVQREQAYSDFNYSPAYLLGSHEVYILLCRTCIYYKHWVIP